MPTDWIGTTFCYRCIDVSADGAVDREADFQPPSTSEQEVSRESQPSNQRTSLYEKPGNVRQRFL